MNCFIAQPQGQFRKCVWHELSDFTSIQFLGFPFFLHSVVLWVFYTLDAFFVSMFVIALNSDIVREAKLSYVSFWMCVYKSLHIIMICPPFSIPLSTINDGRRRLALKNIKRNVEWNSIDVLWTVYNLAKFYMANPFVYTTKLCEERAINHKYSTLMTAACKHHTHEKCPFRGRKDCYKRRLSEARFKEILASYHH